MERQAPSIIRTFHMDFGLKKQIISLACEAKKKNRFEKTNTQGGIHQPPSIPEDGEFDTNVSCFLENKQAITKEIEDAKLAISNLEVSLTLFLLSKPFVSYLW